ncbi:hypothetical protein PSOL_04530 [Candidatus Phytoplasma solani]
MFKKKKIKKITNKTFILIFLKILKDIKPPKKLFLYLIKYLIKLKYCVFDDIF